VTDAVGVAVEVWVGALVYAGVGDALAAVLAVGVPVGSAGLAGPGVRVTV
jgi:hypothetical protein